MMYESETWVITTCIRRVLGRFHHRVAHSLTGKQPRQEKDGLWTYTLMEDVTAEAMLQEVETFISRCQNTVTQFITTRHIIDLCIAVERRLR